MDTLINGLLNIDSSFVLHEAEIFFATSSFFIRDSLPFIKFGLIILAALLLFLIVRLLMKSLETHKIHKGLDLYDFFGFERKKDKLYLEGPKKELKEGEEEE